MSTTALQDDWLAVKIGYETYAINASYIRELIRRQAVQADNLTSDGTEGLTLHRGQALCVVNGVLRLGLDYPKDLATTQGYFIVFDLADQSYALAVTEFIDVLHLDRTMIEPYEWSKNPAVSGVVRHQEHGLMIVLDPVKLLDE